VLFGSHIEEEGTRGEGTSTKAAKEQQESRWKEV